MDARRWQGHRHRTRRRAADLIARNAIELGVPKLEIVAGAAPAALKGLARPDAIFVGGGTSDAKLLAAAWKALPSGGRFVAHAVTAEGEAALIAFHGRHGGALTKIAVARLAAVGAIPPLAPPSAGNSIRGDETMTAVAPGTLYGVGVGPGDPELMTVKAVRLLSRAAVVAYPAPEEGESLARSIAKEHLPPGAAEIALRMPFAPGSDTAPAYDAGAKAIAVHLAAGRDVVCLCAGDPMLYGSFVTLSERLTGRFPVKIVPGV